MSLIVEGDLGVGVDWGFEVLFVIFDMVDFMGDVDGMIECGEFIFEDEFFNELVFLFDELWEFFDLGEFENFGVLEGVEGIGEFGDFWGVIFIGRFVDLV